MHGCVRASRLGSALVLGRISWCLHGCVRASRLGSALVLDPRDKTFTSKPYMV
jgi:hypothetical protein